MANDEAITNGMADMEIDKATDTAIDMSSFLNPALCANIERVVDGKVSPCQNTANQVCGSCNLVQYCSKECQVAHWPTHKKVHKSDLIKEPFLPSWVRGNYEPTFIGDGSQKSFGTIKFLWGNIPALDILNLKDNEGLDTKRDLNLLFAASGDLRNVVKTIVGLPEGYKGHCNVVINDKDFTVVARNAIMLLTALHFEPEVAVPIIIHLWYSVLLPASMLKALHDGILPYIMDTCAKINDMDTSSLKAKKFVVQGSSLKLTLSKDGWNQLRDFLKVPNGLSSEGAQAIRREIMANPARIDYIHRALMACPPALREGTMHFREVGILLPYACSVQDFDTPNPMFFQQDGWPMKDSTKPLEGWLHTEYMKHSPTAKGDEYGSLFFFLRDILRRFCKRVQKGSFSFQLFGTNATELHKYLGKTLFDRIEIANICDMGYINPHVSLQAFIPLLKSKTDNPKAALLMLFLNAVPYMQERLHQRLDVPERFRAKDRVDKLLGIDMSLLAAAQSGRNTSIAHPQFFRRMYCDDMVLDFDKMFNAFLEMVDMVDMAMIVGAKARKKHTIVEPWPHRVKSNTTREEFKTMCTTGLVGHERYMEFKKAY